MDLASDLSKSSNDEEGWQEFSLLFTDLSPPSWSQANVHSPTPLILISGGVEFPLKLMKGPFEIQAIIVLKWRREAWKRREKVSFQKKRAAWRNCNVICL